MKESKFSLAILKNLLDAECLVGDICTYKHKKEKTQVQKHTNRSKNLISVKLVENNT